MAMTEQTMESAGVALPQALSGAQQRILREYVQRVEHVEGELKEAQEARAEVYAEIEEAGFDKKVVKRCVKARQKSRQERDNEQLKFDLYMHALGEIE